MDVHLGMKQLTKSEDAAVCEAIKSSGLIDASESKRLDDLTAYNSTILNHIHGDELTAALLGEVKRYGKSDADLRAYALDNVHPDDLFAALVSKGYTLAKLGISQVQR